MTTYDEVLEQQKEATQRWVMAQSAAIVAQRGPAEPPPPPPPPKPPTVGASAREHFDWWRTHVDSPVAVNYLALALGKVIDRLDELEGH